MGKTNSTVREDFGRLEDDWRPFRRGLRRRDQQAWDTLLDGAEHYRDACHMQNSMHRMEMWLMSMLMFHQREIEALQERLDGVE